MATRRLARTGLDERIVIALSARNVNTSKARAAVPKVAEAPQLTWRMLARLPQELLECNECDLSEMLDVSHEAAARVLKCAWPRCGASCARAERTLRRRVAQACSPEALTVEQLLARRAGEAHHLAFGLRPLDDALRGGAPAGCITELVGQAGAGKTQLCKQLAASAQLPVLHGGMGGSVVYIDTEKKFSAARLVEIATARWPERFATPDAVEALTRGVVLYTPTSGAELLARLDGLEAVIIERGAKLVIVDSIAALMRSEFGREKLVERQALLGAQASKLKQLAEAFRIPIVVTNQVTMARAPENAFGVAPPPLDGGASDAQMAAALGTKWAHDVNTRLSLEVTGGGERLLSVRATMLALWSLRTLS